MLFFQTKFLLLFFPISVLGYFFLKRKVSSDFAYFFLILISFIFYGLANKEYISLLFFSISINIIFYKLISSFKKRYLLFLIISVNLGILFYYKYLLFAFSLIKADFLINASLLADSLPIGISFFTFQQIAYQVDRYNHKESKCRVLDYFLFVSFFPQLIAGPIIKFRKVIPQFSENIKFKISENFALGSTIFMIGFFKKVFLADPLSEYTNIIFEIDSYTQVKFFEAWFGALAFTLQIYFDFSGYTDMAIGIAKFFNVNLPTNFLSPYKSTNIINFWRNWHITLSNFLRDYLYIPLGGNKNGIVSRNINLLTTMLIGGLWHGASLNFVFWGGIHGLLLLVSHYLKNSFNFLNEKFKIFFTFIIIIVTWVPFKASSFNDTLVIWSAMFGFEKISFPTKFVFLEKYTNASPILKDFIIYDGVMGDQFNFYYLLYYCIVGSLIVFFFPNTNTISKNFFNNSKSSIFDNYLMCKPNFIWSLIFSIIFVLGIFIVNKQPTNFIYYDF